MKRLALPVILSLLLPVGAHATGCFSDTFNASDSASFDASDPLGRRGGLLADRGRDEDDSAAEPENRGWPDGVIPD